MVGLVACLLTVSIEPWAVGTDDVGAGRCVLVWGDEKAIGSTCWHLSESVHAVAEWRVTEISIAGRALSLGEDC